METGKNSYNHSTDVTNRLDLDVTYTPVQKQDSAVAYPAIDDHKPEADLPALGDGDEDAWVDDPFDHEDDGHVDYDNIGVSRLVVLIQKSGKWVHTTAQKWTRGYFVALVCLVGYLAYFIAAMFHSFGDEGSYRLLSCTILAALIKLRHKILETCRMVAQRLYGASELTLKDKNRLTKVRFFARWISYGGLAAVVIWMLIEEGREKPENLRSLPGLLLFNLIPVVFSTRPRQIDWHTIYWSNGLQFLSAYIVLKWRPGQECVLWAQDRYNSFIKSSEVASVMLFGETYPDHRLIFNGFPLILFSSGALAILYYLGAMEFVINAIGNLFRCVLYTSPIESTAVALGIFTEGGTTLLMIQPLLITLTQSELFTIVTSAFTSLGGTYISALAAIGVPLRNILPAMVVSAPACFTVCKIIIPECKRTDNGKEKKKDECNIFDMEKKKYTGILDAFQVGALSGTSIILVAIVTCFVFMCGMTWINTSLTWFGDRVGVESLTIEFICSYLLYPVSLAMGVQTLDCRRVALLLGYRICFHNVIAFMKLTEMAANRDEFHRYMAQTNGTGHVTHDGLDIRLDLWNVTLNNGFVTNRSETITTYSLCGFSSFMVVGMIMSVLCVMIPKRKAWIAKMTFPSMIAANIANCMTGCYASIFY